MNSAEGRLSDWRFRNGVLWNLRPTRRSESVDASVLMRQRGSVPPPQPTPPPPPPAHHVVQLPPKLWACVGFNDWFAPGLLYILSVLEREHLLRPVKWLWSLFSFSFFYCTVCSLLSSSPLVLLITCLRDFRPRRKRFADLASQRDFFASLWHHFT